MNRTIVKVLAVALMSLTAVSASAQFGNLGNRIKQNVKNKIQNKAYQATHNPGAVVSEVASRTRSDKEAQSKVECNVGGKTYKIDGRINHEGWNKSQNSKVTFTGIPASIDEFRQLQQTLGTEPQGAVALQVMAFEMYRRDRQWLFRVSMYRDSEAVCAMICSEDWSSVQLFTAEHCVRFAVDNAAMLVFAFASAAMRTLLFHASVIVRQQRAFLFLGHSGTGKSTHSRQWMAAFEDASLLNDDNPVVRIMPDDTVRVYGSPWSGKTPCYKNESALVGALVQLEQAPENHIVPLRMTQAYPHILASVSGLKVMPDMMDLLYGSIARLLELRPVYLLRCLPNPDAARVCAQTCLS